MRKRLHKYASSGFVWLSNLTIFCGLLGVGWWGHSYHWTVPRFSALVGDASAQSARSSEQDSATSPDVEGGNFPSRLPTIEFDSNEAARNCGLICGSVVMHAMDEEVLAHGVVSYDPSRIAQLAVRASGIVWRVEHRVGDVVRRGEPLVIVDSATVGDAKADLLEAVAVFNLKKEDLQRYENLDGIVATRLLREASSAKEVAQARLFNALQRLVNLGFTLRFEDIQDLAVAELSKRLQFLGLPESLRDENASANLIPLVAPFDGVITRCDVVYGEMVEPSKAQYVMADTKRMVIDLDIRPEDAARLHLGTSVRFSTEGDSSHVEGKLTWIGTEIDPLTRTVQARAKVANPPLNDRQSNEPGQRMLKANAFGTAQVLVNKNPSLVVVPNEALHWLWGIGQHIVFVPSDDGRTFSPRVVRAGASRDDYVQILDGLKPGEPIVTQGSRILVMELSDQLERRLGSDPAAVRVFDIVPPASPTPSQSQVSDDGQDAPLELAGG